MENKVRTKDQTVSKGEEVKSEKVLSREGRTGREANAASREKGKREKVKAERGESGMPLYGRWLILLATVIGMGLIGYILVNSYKPDEKESAKEELVGSGEGFGTEQPVLSEAEELSGPSDSAPVIGGVQMMIILAFPIFFGAIIPAGFAVLDIRGGNFEYGVRFFWTVTVLALSIPGVLAYFIIGRRERVAKDRKQSAVSSK